MKTIAAILLGLTLGWHGREWTVRHWRWTPKERTPAQDASRTAYWGIWVVLLLAVMLSGCKWVSPARQPAERVIVTPTGPQTTEQIRQLEQQVADNYKLAQRAAGAVHGAGEANTHNPEGLPKEATAAQIEEAASALPPPTPEQRAEKAVQNSRILAGELVAVRAEMGVAITENQALRQTVGEREQEIARLEAEGARERAAAAAALQRQFDEMTAKITQAQADAAAAEDRARNAVLRDQVTLLNRIAVALGALAVLSLGISAFFGGLGIIRQVAPFAAICGLGSLVSFGLAQIVGHEWFMRSILAVVFLFIAVCGWWIWQKHKAGTLAASVTKKAEKLKTTLGDIVPVLDEAFEQADEATRAALDKLIFQRLSGKMDREEKKLIHEVRAETTP